MTRLRVGEFYEHSKSGKKYKIIAVGKDSETLEDLVIYEAQYDNPTAKIWIRPLKMFIEEVEINGQKLPRFRKI